MRTRENMLRAWFDMWLEKQDAGIDEMFAPDAVYIESWGPEYRGVARIRHWFEEWNARGTVLAWEIRQFIHQVDQTVVEWYFHSAMRDGREEEFEGVSLVRWTRDGKIRLLQEFGCNIARYDPYADGDAPRFAGEKPRWF